MLGSSLYVHLVYDSLKQPVSVLNFCRTDVPVHDMKGAAFVLATGHTDMLYVPCIVACSCKESFFHDQSVNLSLPCGWGSLSCGWDSWPCGWGSLFCSWDDWPCGWGYIGSVAGVVGLVCGTIGLVHVAYGKATFFTKCLSILQQSRTTALAIWPSVSQLQVGLATAITL